MGGKTASDATAESLGVFPHDRVVFFTDAVFAIAMTLLAIEIHPPTHAEIAVAGAAHAWWSMFPLFIAYVTSFLVLGLFWIGNLQALKYVTSTTPRLVWLNILQLLFVGLVPFGTSLYSEDFFRNQSTSLSVYCAILAAIALLSFRLRLAIAKQEGLHARIGPQHTRWFLLRSLIPLLVFALGIGIAYVIPTWAGGWWFMLIWPLSAIARRVVYRQPAGSPA